MATQTLERTKKSSFVEEDVGNIILMEHVNIQVDDQSVATQFYLVGMGFTRDPHMMVGLENMWVNLGENQFHLPTKTPQVLRGHVGIVTPSLDALAARLESVAPKLAGTKFAWEEKGDYIDATSPWGNKYRCYEPAPELGNIRTGIPYIEFTVPEGTADGIAQFYDKALGAVATVEKKKGSVGAAANVDVGQYQHLIFRETPEDLPEYDGHHIAIYIANFSKPYAFLSQRGLVTEEPRNHQIRFKDIVHPKTGDHLFTIEHEVRNLRHPLYHRPLVNRTIGEFLEPRRVGNRTELGPVS